MDGLGGYRKNVFTARFKRAIFFAHIIFLSCTSFAEFNHGVYSIFFSRSSVNSVCDTNNLRTFMQEGHASSNLVRHSTCRSIKTKPAKQSYKTAQSLLFAYQIDVDLCLSLQHVGRRDMPVILKYKSKDELVAIKQSLENFFDRFEHDKHFRKQVSKIKKVGIYKTITIGKKKR